MITASLIVVLGMGIIFVVLGVLLGMMLLLRRLFGPEEKEDAKQ